MRFQRILDDVLGHRPRVTLLRLLLRTRAEHTGRELARLTGLDHKTCHAALQALARQRVVEMRRVGKALSYSVDGGHAVVQQILAPAFEREDRLVEQYADEARRGVHVPLKSVILFGSVARGEEEERSDVDLLFVTRDERTARAARERTWEVMSDLARRYGNVPQIIVVSRQAFRARVRRNHPLFLEILKTGRVLYGCPFGELFAHGA